ncbi:hypothetical protein COW80_00165 [Candidatus Beckwithbacteria bacterium CG22_combo_CG10-13_8_21_14_all_01_47_9]|uniref:Antitoxin n=5 Tax=Candidatus Beckwithiibacteriota TaxID=1752726 RepID=A0A2H0E216_9BACT|nr:MAG: hypothetical protein AUJ59_01485 [Candidatus Beckwithbacteria bacterium CG1_02_47_37]PIP52043.1 MAG: hypothetical protein COX09_03855 [Candidatus Beckwithbacteria bacterium CG23_combo_of_CG06-09_8_20_14_all_47_9]PIP88472.1 MAG: hypothetical protein COW80_00165 [Candidatus Beckwithbacteria bacterium CG22_combo_CG10-13_8_21_14_all_01_47_9]PJA23307.1 MAG: hypothetical protein COX59_00625 [Candidatus Beckwithbacteria bacterium CG_4_10_14_0_2_um_filter_47_25]PJC66026.1 MAG: hypothetical prot
MTKNTKFDPFKDLVLDKYEQEIENALNSGRIKFKPASESLKKMLAEAAKNTLAKKKNINLRVSFNTYFGLKKKAAKLGLPYQTLAGSILHQYASL